MPEFEAPKAGAKEILLACVAFALMLAVPVALAIEWLK